jgi:endoglucanase
MRPYLLVPAALLLCGDAGAATLTGGVNLAAMEFGNDPGVYQWDYTTPTLAEMQYYCHTSAAPIDADTGKGLCLFRLPVILERLEPELMTTKSATIINAAYTGLIKSVLVNAASVGAKVVVDMHDFGGFWNYHTQMWYPLNNSGPFYPTYLARAWRQLATALAGSPGLGGYDLMNEPNSLPTAAVWPQSAQLTTTAIRSVDPATPIYIEGDFYASAAAWTTYNATLNIHDPANKIIYEAHVYGDSDDSGTHYDWPTEAAAGVTVNTIAQRVQGYIGWCKSRKRSCMIGEVGVPNNNANWTAELANGLAAMRAGGLQSFTYWAGGPWWGSYPLSIEPSWTGSAYQDAPQMAVVGRYGR